LEKAVFTYKQTVVCRLPGFFFSEFHCTAHNLVSELPWKETKGSCPIQFYSRTLDFDTPLALAPAIIVSVFLATVVNTNCPLMYVCQEVGVRRVESGRKQTDHNFTNIK
jgi:hypothetical protein